MKSRTYGAYCHNTGCSQVAKCESFIPTQITLYQGVEHQTVRRSQLAWEHPSYKQYQQYTADIRELPQPLSVFIAQLGDSCQEYRHRSGKVMQELVS